LSEILFVQAQRAGASQPSPCIEFQSLERDSVCSSHVGQGHAPGQTTWFQSLERDSVCSSLVEILMLLLDVASFNLLSEILFVQAPEEAIIL